MKHSIAAFLMLSALLFYSNTQAQFILLDNMEGAGPCSGNWFYYKGASSATGKVEFHVPNPSISGLNTSSHVAKFTKVNSLNIAFVFCYAMFSIVLYKRSILVELFIFVHSNMHLKIW